MPAYRRSDYSQGSILEELGKFQGRQQKTRGTHRRSSSRAGLRTLPVEHDLLARSRRHGVRAVRQLYHTQSRRAVNLNETLRRAKGLLAVAQNEHGGTLLEDASGGGAQTTFS